MEKLWWCLPVAYYLFKLESYHRCLPIFQLFGENFKLYKYLVDRTVSLEEGVQFNSRLNCCKGQNFSDCLLTTCTPELVFSNCNTHMLTIGLC